MKNTANNRGGGASQGEEVCCLEKGIGPKFHIRKKRKKKRNLKKGKGGKKPSFIRHPQIKGEGYTKGGDCFIIVPREKEPS